MAQVSIEFPERDVAKIMRALEYQSRAMGVPMREATQNAAKLVAYSAAAATKESKAYRKYEQIRKKTKRRDGLWRIKSDRPGKKDFTVRAGSVRELKDDRRVKIARRGLAKTAWQIIGAQIPGSFGGTTGKTNATAKTKNVAKKFGDVNIDNNVFKPSVTMTNSLGYAIDAVKGGSGGLSGIIGKAARRMFTMTNAAVKREMKAA